MSNIPYADLSDLGETSGENSHLEINNTTRDAAVVSGSNSSDEDKLSENGDIGVGDASYQKSGFRAAKGKNQLKIHQHYNDNEEDFVNINSSLKSSQKSSPCMWLRHPRVRENWKTVAGAIFLLIIGLLFLICGIVLASIPEHNGPKAIIFFVCAAVCILPGAYHTVYVYRATKGWRGYTFESLPSFR